MNRPRIDVAVRPRLRHWLRNTGQLPPKVATAVLTSPAETILDRCGNNPIRVWDIAWDVDRWARTRHDLNEPDGGAYDLATYLYDYAQSLDPTGITDGRHDHNRGRRFRDLYSSTRKAQS